MRARYLVFVVVIWTLLVAGYVNMRLRLVQDVKLHDATPPRQKTRLRLTWDELASGRFQAEYERRLDEKWGLRGVLIRTDNTLHYRLLRETRHRSPVIVGHDGVLFVNEDIAYYNRTDVCTACDDVAARLGRLQRRLLASGRMLLPVIVPAKTTIERAALPERWRRVAGPPPSDSQIYGRMVAALEREGVIYVDGRVRLLALRAETGRPVFPPKARHWSFHAACLVYSDAIRIADAELALGIGATDMPVCELGMRWPPNVHDLQRLMNTFGTPAGIDDLPDAPRARRHDLRPLIVGTSFMWDFARLVKLSTFGHDAHFYYYNDEIIAVATQQGIGKKVDPSDPAWVRWTLERNLYLVDLFEGYLPGAGYNDFLDQLEAVLPPE